MAAQLEIILRAKDLTGNTLKNASKEFDTLGKRANAAGRDVGKLHNTFTGIAKTISMATLPLIGVGIAATKMAMDAVESESLFKVSMGEMEGAARQFSEELRSQFGLNAYEVRKQIGTWNDFISNMGFGKTAAFDMSKGLVQLTNDLSSFRNVKPEEAFTKLQSAIAGETEPLRRWGIDVSEAKVEAYGLAKGLTTAGEKMSQAQKAAIRYALILEQTKNAQGDLARTADSPANAMRRAWNEMQQTLIEVGTEALPVVSAGLMFINKEAIPALRNVLDNAKKSWEGMTERGQMGLIGLAVLMAAGGPLMAAMGTTTRAIIAIGGAFDYAILKGLKLVGVPAMFAAAWESALNVTQGGNFMDRFTSNLKNTGTVIEEWGLKLAESIGASSEFVEAEQRIIAIKKQLHDMEPIEQAAKTFSKGFTISPEAVTSSANILELAARRKQLETELIDLESGRGVAAFDSLTKGAGNFTEQILSALGVSKELVNTLRGANEATQFRPTAKGGMFENEPGQIRKVTQAQNEMTASGYDLNAYLANLRSNFGALGGGGSESASKVAEDMKEAAIGASELSSALITLHPATQRIASDVLYWQQNIDNVNLSIRANSDQLRAAQAEHSRMSDRLGELNNRLSEAKSRLSDLATPRLTGMKALDDQLFSLEQSAKRLDLQKLLLPEGADTSAIDKQIEALRKQMEILRLQGDLKFDDPLRKLKEAAEGTRRELTFEQAMKSIKATKSEIAGLTGEIAGQQAALAAHQAVIDSIQQASEALNRTLEEYQAKLRNTEANQNLVTQALQMAYQWLFGDRQKFTELGAEGERVAAVMDAKTNELLANVTKGATSSTSISSETLALMVKNYQGSMAKSMLEVGKLISQLELIPREITTLHTTVHQDVWQTASGAIPGFANGVNNFSGGWAMVGEKGPELVNLPSGASVIPNGRGVRAAGIDYDQLAAALARQPIVVQMDGQAVARIVRTEDSYIRSIG